MSAASPNDASPNDAASNDAASNDPDAGIHARIAELVAEEHRLERAHSGQALAGEERQRLDQLGVELDRYWDLLRQRQARRAAGQDPDDAQLRRGSAVEGYLQ